MRKKEVFILIAGVLGCMFFKSVATLDLTLSPRHLIWAAVTLVLFVSIMIRKLRPGYPDLTGWVQTPIRLFAGFGLCTVISIFQADNVSESLYEILRVFVMLVFLFCVTVIMQSERNRKLLFRWLIVGAIGLTVIGVIEFFTINYQVRKGTMSGVNLWAAAFLLLLPVCVHGIVVFEKRWRLLSVLAAAGCVFNIITLQTRSVLLALAVGTLAMTLFKKKLILPVISIMVVAGVGMWLATPEVFGNGQTLDYRKQIWTESLIMAKEHPAGVGAGNWRLIIPLHGGTMSIPNVFSKVFYQRPHNDFIWVLAETSAGGAVFYILFFCWILRYAAKSRNACLFAGIVMYIVLACYSFPKERAFHSIMLCIFAAWSMSAVPARRATMVSPGSRRPVGVFIAGIIIVPMLLLAITDFWFRYDMERYMRVIRQREKNWVVILDQSSRYTWFAQMDQTSTPVKWYKGIADYNTGSPLHAAHSFNMANKANPNNIHVLNNLATMASMFGAFDDAWELMRRALTICPKNKELVENNLKLSDDQRKWKETENEG